MKLYLFAITGEYGKPKFPKEEYEVEETEKTYKCKGRRFLKSDIGIVTGYSHNECMLTENDSEKAAKILLEEMKSQMDVLKERMERKQAQIDKLKEYIR